MSEKERLDQVVFGITDFCNAMESALVSFRKNIEGLGQFTEYDLEKLVWETAQGPSGPYEVTSKQSNNDSAEWKALVKDLNVHNGKLSRQSFFIWNFQNNPDKVGRKKRKF